MGCLRYKEQRDDFVIVPRIQPGWFIDHRYEYMEEHTVLASKGYTDREGNTNAEVWNTNDADSDACGDNNSDACSHSGMSGGSLLLFGCRLSSSEALSGYTLTSIQKDDKWLYQLCKHNRECGHDAVLVSRAKHTFGIRSIYHCSYCKMDIF